MLVREQKPYFLDRQDAARRLAEKLSAYSNTNAIALAIPRGGIPVAIEVARKLGIDFDVLVVRKIPIPDEPEAGYGAITSDGTVVLNEALLATLRLTEGQMRHGIDTAKAEMARRNLAYRGDRPFPSLDNRTAIIIDDGLASGFTMIAAIRSVRKHGAKDVVAAVPVASRTAYERVSQESDQLVAVIISDTPWFAVASFYSNWYDLSENEALNLLQDWRLENDRTPAK